MRWRMTYRGGWDDRTVRELSPTRLPFAPMKLTFLTSAVRRLARRPPPARQTTQPADLPTPTSPSLPGTLRRKRMEVPARPAGILRVARSADELPSLQASNIDVDVSTLRHQQPSTTPRLTSDHDSQVAAAQHHISARTA